MVPCHAHWQVAVWSNAGTPQTVTGAGGSHGSEVAGTHGAGVNTPSAAVVAACTAGLTGELHIPNVMMFVSGTKSVTTARGASGGDAVATCGGPGVRASSEGLAPISHASCAPLATRIAITSLSQIALPHTTAPLTLIRSVRQTGEDLSANYV